MAPHYPRIKMHLLNVTSVAPPTLSWLPASHADALSPSGVWQPPCYLVTLCLERMPLTPTKPEAW